MFSLSKAERFVKKNVNEYSLPLFHLLPQSYVANDVFTVPKIPAEAVSKATGCLWGMSETTRGQQLLTVWDTGAVVCVTPVSTIKPCGRRSLISNLCLQMGS